MLLLDRAGRHATPGLDIPETLTLIFLPSRAPQPFEDIWQHLRANKVSNRAFETHAVLVDAACEAWNRLPDQPETIISVGLRDWAHVGQT